MVLRNGKFYEGDVLVPLEFGNKLQLKLIEKVEALREGDVLADVDDGLPGERFAISHTCVCGTRYRHEFTYSYWNRTMKQKANYLCDCGLRFDLDGLKHSPFVTVKLIEKETTG